MFERHLFVWNILAKNIILSIILCISVKANYVFPKKNIVCTDYLHNKAIPCNFTWFGFVLWFLYVYYVFCDTYYVVY